MLLFEWQYLLIHRHRVLDFLFRNLEYFIPRLSHPLFAALERLALLERVQLASGRRRSGRWEEVAVVGEQL